MQLLRMWNVGLQLLFDRFDFHGIEGCKWGIFVCVSPPLLIMLIN